MAEAFVPAIKLADVPANGMVSVAANGVRITVADVQGTYYAFDDEFTLSLHDALPSRKSVV